MFADTDGPRVTVRTAAHGDVPALAAGVVELLAEIGGKPPPTQQLEATAHALIDDPDAGAIMIAECEGQLLGVLGASWQSAIRVPGRYGLIQELWVHPEWRGQNVGAELLSALCELARQLDVGRLEVGLPSERFLALANTEAFYAANDFSPIGTRMRRLLR